MRRPSLALVLCFASSLVAHPARAQPSVSLSWDACAGAPGAATEKSFSGPGVYRQVVSGTGFSGPVGGYEVVLRARAAGGLADAWRFDIEGCQAGRAAIATAASSKACPSLAGTSSLNTTFTYDPVSGSIDLRMTTTFAPVMTTAGTTYTLFRIDYDLGAATTGATEPGTSCGGAGQPVCFAIVDARWLDGAYTEQPASSGGGSVTWNDPAGTTACSDANLDGVRVDEMMTACASGDTTVQFVELVADRPSTYSSSLRLRVRTSAGEEVLDATDLFPGREGQPWPAGTRWLLATRGFEEATGLAADLVLPLALDSEGGSIVLTDDRAGAPAVHALEYGPPGETPAPAPGRSLRRDPAGVFHEAASPDPTNASGASPTTFACRSTAAGVRIQEFAIDCVGCVRRNSPFVELVAVAPGQRFASGLRLRFLDPSGFPRLDVGNLFDAAHADESWPEGRTWLLGPSTSTPAPDRAIGAPLSATGGRVQLYDVAAGGVVVSELRYGPGGFPAPALGRSLERIDDTTYVENPTPSPTRHDGALSAPPECYGPPPGPLMAASRFSEIGLACSGGDTRSEFIELTTPSDQALHSRIRLRVRNATGAIVLDRGSLFAPRANGTIWPAGRTWLFATQVFSDLTGLVPDLVLPVTLAENGATLTLYDATECDSLVIDEIAYGAGAVPPPAPGRSLERIPDGSLVETSLISPTRFDGTSVSENSCECAVPVRISELGLACSGGDARSQYIELTSTADQVLPPGLRLRVRNANGSVLFDQISLFDSRPAGTPWPAGGTWLLATQAFADLTGLSPDFGLNPLLPADGATLTLYDVGVCASVTLDEVRYGLAGGPPPPAPGHGLERAADGSLSEVSAIHPTRFDGGTVGENPCPCPVSTLQCDRDVDFVAGPQGRVECEGVRAEFDLLLGVASAESDEVSGAAVVEDEFTVTGPAPGTSVHFAALIEAWVNACPGFHGSASAGCEARDGSNVVRLERLGIRGAGACASAQETLRLELHKVAGEPFRLGFLARSSPQMTAGADARLRFRFVDLPPGARITSCHGYLQEVPTAARTSLVTNEVGAGRVRLVWQGSSRADLEGTLERRTEVDAWSAVASLRSGPTGLFEYEDPGVEAGGRFAYRLEVVQDGLREWTDPVWVDVPSGLRLAIQGIAPNPSAGDAFISFSLPSPAPARIELLDIQGRKVRDQELGALEAGRHVVRLAGSERLASGVYLLRLLQAGEIVVSKLTRMR